MAELIIKTKKAKEVVDITDRVNEFLKNEGVGNGQVHLFLTHTTAALTTADLDPGTDLDMLDALEALIPQHANGAPPPDGSGPDRKSRILDGGRDNANAPMRIKYRHPHDPSHVPDHILSSLIGASLTLPVRGGALILGTWQRIVLIEFSGPRERRIVVSLL